MQNDITIIDYGMGNLRSVEKSFMRVGANVIISDDPLQIQAATKLVLPGVGHYGTGVQRLKNKGLWDILNDVVLIKQVPILGICLGMQLMTRHSDEGDTKGFGWIKANAVQFSVADKLRYKIPHIGWNSISHNCTSSLLEDVPDGAMFYFLHSYYVKCDNTDEIVATTIYESEYTSAIHKENIYATQFHPEKSHEYGDKILKNYLSI
jgi:imidazole glycerol-phosphate synthase subunit HisH